MRQALLDDAGQVMVIEYLDHTSWYGGGGGGGGGGDNGHIEIL